MSEISSKLKKGMKKILCNMIDDVDKILKERSNDTKGVLLDAISESIEEGLEKGKQVLKSKIMESGEEEDEQEDKN